MGAQHRHSYGERMVTRREITLPETAARGLRRWMRAVGGFYVLMGLFNSPPIIQACGGLTTVWALAAGIWALRNPAAVDA
jgi:hypothetical protein